MIKLLIAPYLYTFGAVGADINILPALQYAFAKPIVGAAAP